MNRIMPKRPNAICIGPGSQIICGDKFGDVYALPLIASDSPAAVAARRINVSKPFTKPTANETTVHSKKNLKSLKAQQKQAEQMLQGRVSAEPKSDAPDFELTLLLGHVSMITSMVLGEIKGKTVILTGDRDEHIRVSRYIPQAYVIEGFCLGHNDFVTAMTIPKARGEILVSAGGDSDMFVWNWQEGSILSRSSILSLAQEIRPDTSKVAVSKVLSFGYTSETGTHTYVLAICEG
jgi:tRNA (guanine-N(7)-)-methyltransferase subunit TRM82